MLGSSIIAVDVFSNSLLNVILSLGTISCLHSFTRIYLYENKLFQKLQLLTWVDQEIVAINDNEIPIFIHFID